ncbi:peroxidase [Aureococcus anophagefferens]|nr:peroxidase [Aureococcus anophagefferens]
MGRLGLALLLAPALRAADDRTCADDHENCEFWASQGECFDNPSYMRTHCALSCESCAPDGAGAGDAPAWTGGCFDRDALCGDWAAARECDVNPGWMLENCAASRRVRGQRRAAARARAAPRRSRRRGRCAPGPGDARRTLDRALATGGAVELHGDPPSYLPAFAHPREADELIARALDATAGWSALRYGPGDRRVHRLPEQVHMPCGLRAFTLLLYLNDVAAGGETVFTKLANVSVAPRKGAAVLWANVDDRDDPLATCDDRTFHEARPIDAGVKQAANIWFHTHDFRTPYRLGCTG